MGKRKTIFKIHFMSECRIKVSCCLQQRFTKSDFRGVIYLPNYYIISFDYSNLHIHTDNTLFSIRYVFRINTITNLQFS